MLDGEVRRELTTVESVRRRLLSQASKIKPAILCARHIRRVDANGLYERPRSSFVRGLLVPGLIVLNLLVDLLAGSHGHLAGYHCTPRLAKEHGSDQKY